MYLFAKDEKAFINCDNIAYFKIQEPWTDGSDGWKSDGWKIHAVFSGGSYIELGRYNYEEDCKNDFDRLWMNIANGRTNDTIYMDCLK